MALASGFPPVSATPAGAYQIEPDASNASYFFAAAAVTGGRVRVEGLGAGSTQGDLRFVDVLERDGRDGDDDGGRGRGARPGRRPTARRRRST